MRTVMRPWPVVLWLSVAVGFAGAPALAETGNGSKNFHAPSSVPNYFSNEAGPMLGGPAEARRVDLYPNPGVAVPPPRVEPTVTSPTARTRHAVVTRQGRVRIAANIRGGRYPTVARGHTQVRTHLAARGAPRLAAHGAPPSHSTHAAAARTTHVSNTHHHGRG